MRKFLSFTLIALFSNTVVAAVNVELTNVPNDKKIFITSLDTGERIYAVNAGNFAVISNAALRHYRSIFSKFTAGIDDGSTIQYCTDHTSHQFTFTASGYSSSSFYLRLVKNNDGILVPFCKKYAWQ